MNHIPVVSSQIKSVAYNEKDNILYVEFIKGNFTYKYYNVMPVIFIELLNAPSVGSYFMKNINNQYEFEKIN